tara:strand:- start:118042 stop:119832 length:1791 start_codon:yes stop_codon:yes gene_type:complete
MSSNVRTTLWWSLVLSANTLIPVHALCEDDLNWWATVHVDYVGALETDSPKSGPADPGVSPADLQSDPRSLASGSNHLASNGEVKTTDHSYAGEWPANVVDSDVSLGSESSQGQVVRERHDDVLPLSLAAACVTSLQNNRDIRVLSKEPTIASQQVTIADAEFDPYYALRAHGGEAKRQLADTLTSFGAATNIQEQDFFDPFTDPNNLSIGRRLRTGGVIELGFGTEYDLFDPVGPQRLVNPAWDSSLNLRLEQPLLAGAGRQITESIITIARADQRQALESFQADVNQILLDVELAYWDVALRQRLAKDFDALLVIANKLVESETIREDLGEGVLPDVTEARVQVLRIRQLKAKNEAALASANEELANLLGLDAAQRVEIIATTDGQPDALNPDLDQALLVMTARPELRAQEAAIQRASIELTLAIDQLRPDLRLYFEQSLTGLDDRLDDSIDTVSSGRFNTWAVGLVLQRSVRRRAEFAAVRAARLRVCQEQDRLEALRQQFAFRLQGIFNRMLEERKVLEIAEETSELADRQYRSRLELRNEGQGNADAVFRSQSTLLTSQLDYTEAQIRLLQLYAQWQYEQGVICNDRFEVN